MFYTTNVTGTPQCVTAALNVPLGIYTGTPHFSVTHTSVPTAAQKKVYLNTANPMQCTEHHGQKEKRKALHTIGSLMIKKCMYGAAMQTENLGVPFLEAGAKSQLRLLKNA